MKQHVQTLTATFESDAQQTESGFDHFADVEKMVALGSGSKREIDDVGSN